MCTPMFIAALFIIVNREQPECSSTEERIKMWHTWIMEHCSAIKKNETMPPAATWMDLETVTLSEVSQRKTTTCYHLYVESKSWHKWTDLRNRNRVTDTENGLVDAKAGGGGGRNGPRVWDEQMQTIIYRMDKQSPYCIAQGTCDIYPVINHNGKEYEKECIYV